MTTSAQTLTFRERVRWILEHWAVYRGEVPLLLGLTVANALVLVAYPFLLKRIIDGIQESLTPGFLWGQVALLLGVGILHFFIYAVMQYRRALLNMRFEFGVRLRAFEYLLRLGPLFFSRFRTGDVVTRLNDDVTEKISWFLCSGVFRVLEAAVLIVFGIAMMLYINPTLTLYTATPLPILVALFVVTGHQLHQRYEAVQQSISELNDSLESCFSGIRVVKAFGVEENQQRLVEHTIEEQRRAEIKAVLWQTIIDSLYGNIWQLAIVAVLLAGGMMVIAGEVTLGDLIAFDTYVLMLVWPMFDIGQFFVRGKLCAVSIDRVAEVERFPPEVCISETPEPIARHIASALPDEEGKQTCLRKSTRSSRSFCETRAPNVRACDSAATGNSALNPNSSTAAGTSQEGSSICPILCMRSQCVSSSLPPHSFTCKTTRSPTMTFESKG